MKTTKTMVLFMALILFSVNEIMSQVTNSGNVSDTEEIYLLERELSDTSEENLQNIATSAQGLVKDIGPQVEWVHSYVTNNKMICVFKYQNKNALAEHAERAGLQLSELKKVERKIGPEDAEKN